MNRVQAYGVGEVDLANALASYDVYAALLGTIRGAVPPAVL